jgi:hypothetical protein
MRSELSSKIQSIQKATFGERLDKSATTLRADFRFAPLNILALLAIFVIGLAVHLSLYRSSKANRRVSC